MYASDTNDQNNIVGRTVYVSLVTGFEQADNYREEHRPLIVYQTQLLWKIRTHPDKMESIGKEKVPVNFVCA